MEEKQILDALPVGVVLFGEDLCIIRMNPRAAALGGCLRDDPLGLSLHEALPKVASRVEFLLRTMIEAKHPQIELFIEQPEEQRRLLVSCFLVSNAKNEQPGIGLTMLPVEASSAEPFNIFQTVFDRAAIG